ncbi:hypothetical protein SAMN05880592_11655 [Bosea sp. TND4EK4]|nr:hypothetical protein SAMN05880592_11655 [Bosea sp. TND4EK4]
MFWSQLSLGFRSEAGKLFQRGLVPVVAIFMILTNMVLARRSLCDWHRRDE